ncbi:MAG: hypothetical protein ACK56I_34875, partial [bacterium]
GLRAGRWWRRAPAPRHRRRRRRRAGARPARRQALVTDRSRSGAARTPPPAPCPRRRQPPRGPRAGTVARCAQASGSGPSGCWYPSSCVSCAQSVRLRPAVASRHANRLRARHRYGQRGPAAPPCRWRQPRPA